MNNLVSFVSEEFGRIRTLTIDGETWLVGKDIADILKYQNGSRDINRHVDYDDRRKMMVFDGNQDKETIVINESGLYSLVLSSKLPSAKRFKHWVTSEVLPAIRKHGVYAVEELLNNPDALITALQAFKEEKAKRIALEEENGKQKALLEEQQPKVIFADAVTASSSSILVRDLAKLIRQNGVQIGEKRLYQWMRENGYIVKNGTQPTQRAMELGLFEVVERSVQRSDLKPIVTITTKVTGKGQQYFINKFLNATAK